MEFMAVVSVDVATVRWGWFQGGVGAGGADDGAVLEWRQDMTVASAI